MSSERKDGLQMNTSAPFSHRAKPNGAATERCLKSHILLGCNLGGCALPHPLPFFLPSPREGQTQG